MLMLEAQRSTDSTPGAHVAAGAGASNHPQRQPDSAEAAAVQPPENNNEEVVTDSWQGYSRANSLDDVEGHGEETSTASGTTITEVGWESGQGFDVEESLLGLTVAEKDKVDVKDEEEEEGSVSPRAVPKRSSFQRVLDNAR